MSAEKKPHLFLSVATSIMALLAIMAPAQQATDPQPLPAADPTATQAAPVAVAPADDRKINLILVGYDIENNAAAKKMLEDMAQAALASGAKGQVLLASKDNAVDLQQAMFRAVNIATGQAQGSGGGGLVSSADSGQSSLLVILLVAVILLVLVSIILLRRNRSAPPGVDADHAVQASLEIYSAGGGLKIVAIASSRTAIGRAPDNQLVIADSSVSQHHAEIVANERGFLIRDLGSANGTRVNGKKIGECSLYLGDEIALGSMRMKLGR